jgi:hypothetical protein
MQKPLTYGNRVPKSSQNIARSFGTAISDRHKWPAPTVRKNAPGEESGPEELSTSRCLWQTSFIRGIAFG